MLDKTDKFVQAVSEAFPLRSGCDFNTLYVMSNELGYAAIIRRLLTLECKNTETLKVSLLFGESNFLSLLPAIEKMADIVLLADVNPDLHAHTAFILRCFRASDSPEQFKARYLKNNPACKKINPNTGRLHDTDELEGLMDTVRDSTRQYYFLNSQTNFDKAKAVLAKVKLVQIYLNLANKHSCRKLNALLLQHAATFTLCNFTNIKDYFNGAALDWFKKSASSLLAGHSNTLIMHSTHNEQPLRTNITTDLSEYLGKKPSDLSYRCFLTRKSVTEARFAVFSSNSQLFFTKPEISKGKNAEEFCYLAVFACKESKILRFWAGNSGINFYATAMHAQDTIEAVNAFVAEGRRQKSLCRWGVPTADRSDYWILKIRCHKDKVYDYLQHFDNRRSIDYPHDVDKTRFFISSNLLEVIKSDGSKILTKPEAETGSCSGKLKLE